MSHTPSPDWSQVRVQLEICAQALQAAISQLPAPADRVADGSSGPDEERRRLDLVTFGVGRERYALEAHYVSQILPSATVTPIPGIHGALAGVAPFAGIVLPVFDLAPILGLAHVDDLAYDRILAIGHQGSELGLLSGTQEASSTVAEDELRPVPWSLEGEDGALIRGVTRDGTIVLDGQSLLADRRLFIDRHLRHDRSQAR